MLHLSYSQNLFRSAEWTKRKMDNTVRTYIMLTLGVLGGNLHHVSLKALLSKKIHLDASLKYLIKLKIRIYNFIREPAKKKSFF